MEIKWLGHSCFEIKDNKKNDGEIKLILKFLKLIPYLEINLLDSKFIKKRITLKSIEKTIKIAKLKLYKDKITRFLEITKVEELYLKINLQKKKEKQDQQTLLWDLHL